MHNCYKIFRNGRLYAIAHNEIVAELIVNLIKEWSSVSVWTIEPAFIEGIGF